MVNIDKAQEFCNELTDIYSEDYSNAVINLRSYIQVLIINIEIDKYKSLKERLKILAFIEDKFSNDVDGFLEFIKKINDLESNDFTKNNIEESLKDILWFEWTWILK